jgi:hypothetical protein
MGQLSWVDLQNAASSRLAGSLEEAGRLDTKPLINILKQCAARRCYLDRADIRYVSQIEPFSSCVYQDSLCDQRLQRRRPDERLQGWH